MTKWLFWETYFWLIMSVVNLENNFEIFLVSWNHAKIQSSKFVSCDLVIFLNRELQANLFKIIAWSP